MPVMTAGLRVAVGIILIVAGALKVGHPAALAASIADFRLFPPQFVAPLAIVLPYLELFVGAYLVIGLFTRVMAAIAAVQFTVYGLAIASAVLRHIQANCGCFGPWDQAKADWPHVALDLALAGVSLLVARTAPGTLALDRTFSTKKER